MKFAKTLKPVGRARVAAQIWYRNRLISTGFGHKKSHPFQAEYGTTYQHIYFHAEIHAIYLALNKINLKKLEKSCMYIVRYKKSNGWGLAKPCRGCQRALAQFNINEVIYTLNDFGKYERLQ